jgi:hypothetical protein
MPIPINYWVDFNKAESLYKQNKYLETKRLLLKYIDLETHSGYIPFLLRVYRKLIQKAIIDKKLINAIAIYDEFFTVCKGQTTNTDNRNYNKIVDSLSQSHPELAKRHVEKTKILPDFTIHSNGKNLNFVRSYKGIPTGQAPRGVYYQVYHYNDCCWYIKNFYNNDKPDNAFAKIYITTANGVFRDEITVDHLIYRIDKASGSDLFVTVSFDLKLYLYQGNACKPKVTDLSSKIEDRYMLGGLSISLDEKEIFVAVLDKLYIFDRTLGLINTYVVPKISLDNHKRSSLSVSPEISNALITLGITENSVILDDLKNAFNKKIRQVHPDLHPNDEHANEKTRDVLDAYEILIKKYHPNEHDYEKIRIDFGSGCHIFIGCGNPEDHIRTLCVLENGDLLVGCYSGNVYQVQNDFVFRPYFKSKIAINQILENGEYVYCTDRSMINILKNKKFLNRIPISWGFERLINTEKYFLIKATRQLRVFTCDGELLGVIETKNSISDAYFDKESLLVIISNKIMAFTISADEKVISQKKLLLENLDSE